MGNDGPKAWSKGGPISGPCQKTIINFNPKDELRVKVFQKRLTNFWTTLTPSLQLNESLYAIHYKLSLLNVIPLTKKCRIGPMVTKTVVQKIYNAWSSGVDQGWSKNG